MLTNIDVQSIIPHRYPFLLVDKILEVEPGKRAVGIKNVTANEPFFQGHFPGNPIMPGVLIVEALAQTACVAGLLMEENKGKLGVFTGIDGMKIRRQVVPGDTLKLEAEFLVFKMGMGKVKVRATVDGDVACEGEIKFAMVDPNKNTKDN
ncbi:3-hydroxyacyl-ACP dehydratase FabZ [Acetivibrio cellulolyticus]|uniref:3-hydroxyacyl-ACP dehydratase FabZ n=1 Tax=Acetivibrio cellulolyticus TaxID=35830 RepID=UPI0001E2CC33|nr:3-hydroxyacyl-ACP dehydratase FabZ [Acetivibrio cellulolyticus]